MPEKIESFQRSFWKIYSIVCGIATPLMFMTAFTDEGFINMVAYATSGVIWVIACGLTILGIAVMYDKYRVSLIEEDREEEQEAKQIDIESYAREIEEAPISQIAQSEADLIEKLKSDWKDRLNFYDYKNLKKDTPGYKELHKVILNLTKTWTRGENVNRDRNKHRGFYSNKKPSAPTPIVLNPHL